MSHDIESRWERWRLGYNATAAAAGALAAPLWSQALHIAGDQYGVALAALAVAAWVDHRADRWTTRAALFAVSFGGLLDLPALAQAVYWLTGVRA